jgi:hypothetical protein
MAQPLARDMLQQAITDLPDDLAREVLDFVLFVQARRTEEAQLWAEVEATRRYRQTHPDHTQTVSAEEWDRLTAHLDEEDV